jgi:hypothetical protein
VDTGIFVDPQPSPGSYWFGACVAPDGVEFDTGNNCSAGVPVTVLENTSACTDLPISCGGNVSSNLTSTDCDNSPRGTGYYAKKHTFDGGAGDEIVINADWSGDGYLYLENPSGVVVAQNDDNGVDASSSRISHTLAVDGSWTIWTTTAITDIEMSFDLSLACAGAPEPDLTVDAPEVSPQAIVSAGLLSISTTVRNVGGVSATMSTLRYLASTDSVITPGDALLASEEVGNLGAGASSAFSTDAPGPVLPGTYWIGVCVDCVADETVTGNNCSAGVEITVSENSNDCVDVAISCGEMLSGDIAGTDCDDSPRGAGHLARSFSFSASEGDTVTVDAAWSGDGYLYLEDPSGATVAEIDNSGSVLASRIVRTLESGGT